MDRLVQQAIFHEDSVERVVIVCRRLVLIDEWIPFTLNVERRPTDMLDGAD